MLAYFGQTLTLTVDFGVNYTGLVTVGYALYNGNGTEYQARTTTGVSEVASAGIYQVQLASDVFVNVFDGYVIWDTGDAEPRYAIEDILIAETPPGGSDYTPDRAALLDNLDATITSRLASEDYTVPDNVSILAIQDRLPSDPADESALEAVIATVQASLDALRTAYTDERAILLDNLDIAVSTRASPADIEADLEFLEIIMSAVKARTDLIGTPTVSITSPIITTRRIVVYCGDDYLAIDGRALLWIDDDSAWPDLTGHSASFIVASLLDVPGTILDGDTVQVELTSEQTSLLEKPSYPQLSYPFALIATIGASTVTLASGTLTAINNPNGPE